MQKNLRLFCLLFGLLLMLARSTSAQKTAGDYWPLKQGNFWKMTMQIGGRKVSGMTKVVKSVTSGKETVSTVTQTINGSVESTEKYRTTPAGIFRISSGKNGSVRTEPSLPIVKFPMKKGDTWDWNGKINTNGQESDASANMSVSGPETVKTPAGTYRAMKVHIVVMLDAQGQKIEFSTDYYFVSGVGVVRQSMNLGGITMDAKMTGVKVKK